MAPDQVLGLVQDLYAASKDNKFFLHGPWRRHFLMRWCKCSNRRWISGARIRLSSPRGNIRLAQGTTWPQPLRSNARAAAWSRLPMNPRERILRDKPTSL